MPLFENGNEYYKVRLKDGRFFEYEDIEHFTNECNSYFQFCIDNPLKSAETVTFQGSGDTFEVDKLRVFSISGICTYLQIALNTWKNYKNRPDFLTVITICEQIIENQQFEGASAGLLNANIISQKLGLVHKFDQTSGGDKIQTSPQIDLSKLSDKTLRELADATNTKP